MPSTTSDLKSGCRVEVTQHTGSNAVRVVPGVLVKIENGWAVVDLDADVEPEGKALAGRIWSMLFHVAWMPSESEIVAKREEIQAGWSPAIERWHRGVRAKEDDAYDIPRVGVPTVSRGEIRLEDR